MSFMKYYSVKDGNSYDKTDYDVHWYRFEDEDIINIISEYLTSHKLSKRRFAEENNINYNYLLKCLNGENGVRYDYTKYELSNFIRITIENDESEKNKVSHGFYLSSFEIDIMKLICNSIINGKNKLVIGGSNMVYRYTNIIDYLSKNNITTRTDVYNGKGDYSPTITFVFYNYSVEIVKNILNKLNF